MFGRYIYIYVSFLLGLVMMFIACNPFAPGENNSTDGPLTSLGDQRTSEGVFQNLRRAYLIRDTIVYGQLVGSNFTFVYHDYDRGVDVSWGRDEEMRMTYGLFQNVQQLDLVWNDTLSTSTNQENTQTSVSRRFNLTVTFNPSDIVRVDGYAIFQMERQQAEDPWMIVRWNDESNF